MPGQAAISSTPAATSRHRSMRSQDLSQLSDATPSWASSLESPLVRLDREIQSLGQDDAVSVASTSMANFTILDDVPSADDDDITQRPMQTNDDTYVLQSERSRGKARETPQPLLRNVLQRNTGTADSSNATRRSSVSPLKLKQKTPVLRKLNPYLPPSADPSRWSGVVDLKDPSTRSPSKVEPSPAKHQRFTFHPPASTSTNASFKRPLTPKRVKTGHDADDDSFDEGFGMSPPITMDWARLPKLGQTPRKEAAERIMNKLLDVERRSVFSVAGPSGTKTQRGIQGAHARTTESSLSSMPTPPSLSRYARPAETSSSMVDASLESLMRRVGSEFDYGRAAESVAPTSTSVHPEPAAYRSSEVPKASSSSQSAYRPPAAPQTPEYPQYDLRHLKDDELQPPGSLDTDSDSLDDEEFNDPANPSAAFILASQRASYDDDDSSFESNQDSLDELPEGHEPVHPFARAQAYQGMEDDDFDDSFDDDLYDQQANTESTQEETVFGVPPAQRLQMEAQQEERRRQQQFRVLGEHLLEDTMGIGAQMASQGRVEETPTPWMGGRGA